MGTKRQKPVEAQHLSGVKAQRNRATAPISVSCQWPEYAERRPHKRNAWSAKSFGTPFLPSGGSAHISQPTPMPCGRRRFGEAIRGILKLYTNSSDAGY